MQRVLPSSIYFSLQTCVDIWNPPPCQITKIVNAPLYQFHIHLFQVLEKFLGSIPENNRYQQQILSMYLSCSGYTEPNNKCLDRVVCDYSDNKSTMNINDEEKDVISM